MPASTANPSSPETKTVPKARARGEKTRLKILAAAESIFANEGFDAARMEDIASAVGIQRAGLFYYYKDKRALYQAMLENVMAQLSLTIQEQVNSELSLHQQIENCAIAWVDYVWQQPHFAKILLREGVKPSEWLQQEISNLTQPLLNLLQALVEQAQQKGEIDNPTIDPLHIASTLAGATVFSLSVFPSLITELKNSVSEEKQLQQHREHIRKLTQFLLSE